MANLVEYLNVLRDSEIDLANPDITFDDLESRSPVYLAKELDPESGIYKGVIGPAGQWELDFHYFGKNEEKAYQIDRFFGDHRDFKGYFNVWLSNRQNPNDVWVFDIYKLGKEMPKNNYEISTLENIDWSKTPQILQNPQSFV